MPEVDSTNVIEAIMRRSDVLGALETGQAKKTELVERLDVSRSTINRGLQDLSRLGLVQRDERGYQLTLAGRLVFEEYRRFRGQVDDVVGNVALLSALERDVPFETAVLDSATVVTADQHSPYRPMAQAADLVERATHVRAFAPAVVPRQVEAYRQRIVDDGMTAEFVLSDQVIELLVSSHADALHETLETGLVEIRRAESVLPYGLIVAETADGPQMGLIVYGNSGARGFVGNDHPAAVAWAWETVTDCWTKGDPLSMGID
jgi:predicted transcriptional regulator